MRALALSFVLLLSLVGCGAELPEQERASLGQEVTAQAVRCVTHDCDQTLWCLGKCTRTGATLHVVAYSPKCGTCTDLVDDFCRARHLGVRDSACWGTPW